jgi:ABC-type transport system involved in cytochrome bd biosynthesis fused ATPase/permease subunit
VLLITHRPASLALADRVLRLEQGELREVGIPG